MTWIEPDRVDFALYLAARPSNGSESEERGWGNYE